MRGRTERQQSIFIAFDLEQRVPDDHPLRKIKRWADRVLAEMSRDFSKAYGTTGRPGIPPEQLIKALLLQALYSIPSETKLVEAIQWNVLYRWFLDLPMEKDAWTQEAFSMIVPPTARPPDEWIGESREIPFAALATGRYAKVA